MEHVVHKTNPVTLSDEELEPSKLTKLMLFAQIVGANGKQCRIPLDTARFMHYDTPKDPTSMRFQRLGGWIILEKLVPVMMFFVPGCMVEIGAGASTRILAGIAEDFDVTLHTCDIKAEKNKTFGKNHIYYEMMSEEFIKIFDGLNDTPSVVFIDGDHDYAVAKMEFDFFFEKLKDGGVIFLHDTMPLAEDYTSPWLCSDVYRLRQELEKESDIMDCFTFPYTAGYHGLTMVRKKGEGLSYWEK
jgi:hypothetical protein